MHTNREFSRKLRAREKRRYTEEFGDEEIEGRRQFSVEEKLLSDKFDRLFVHEMKGEDVTLRYFQENGFDAPIVVCNKTGLGIKMPDKSFTVNDVRQCVGNRRVLDVMDVTTQKDFEMTMKEWCAYYENPIRERLLNVISLEFSRTKLESLVESPTIVRQVDWVDWVWPKYLKSQQTESTNAIEEMKYPKVQKYCLMSVKGCYTDFHIDFGGTSVWYHILKGCKVFWLIPPSERNIQLYEQWVLSGKQTDIFFGDTVEQCARIKLYDGYTFFIPTGWIHAVYTSEDSLVFGGNFLHSFAIEKQLRIAQVEDITKVPAKFRYPFYYEMLWYVLQRYVQCLTGKNHLKYNEYGEPCETSTTSNNSLYSNHIKFKSEHRHLTSFELNGLKAIIMWLSRLSASKRCVPELVKNPEALLNDAKLLVDDHSNDDHKLAITGKPILFWSKHKEEKERTKPTTSSSLSSLSSPLSSSGLSVTAQLRQIKNTSFNTFHLSKTHSTHSEEMTIKRPESPPTRPISSNQYSISNSIAPTLDIIPQSFAQLIAATGIGTQNRTFGFPIKLPPGTHCSIATTTQTQIPENGNIDKGVSIENRSFSPDQLKMKKDSADSARRRRTRCKKCESCTRSDCGDCHFCKDMKKFGGPGRMKQSCIARQCMAPVLPHTACCMICGRDGWDRMGTFLNEAETQSSLLECSKCWEIVHPLCLKEKNPELTMESVMSDELPNSWECPKCVASSKFIGLLKPRPHKPFFASIMESGGSTNGPINLVTPKKDVYDFSTNNILPESVCKKPRMNEHSFERITKLEERKHDEIDDNESINESKYNTIVEMRSVPQMPQNSSKLFHSHVRSCARFPLLQEAIKQQQQEKKQGPVMKTPVKTSFEKIGRNNKKHNESSRDRLFKSLKGLKKNSEMSRISYPSNGYFNSNKKSFSRLNSSHSNGMNNENSEIIQNTVSTSTSTDSLSLEEDRKVISTQNKIDDNNDYDQQDNSNNYDDETDEEIYESIPSVYASSEDETPDDKKILQEGQTNKRQLCKPKYVVRPAPLPEDLSATEEEDEEDDEDDEDEDSDLERVTRSKMKQKMLSKLKKKSSSHLVHNRDIIVPVLSFLSRSDLLNCMLVCKSWNGFAIDPSLWKRLDLTRKVISSEILMGIVRRQPIHLNLSWANISKRQLSWLIARLPQLESLSLSGLSSNTISALCTCNCPLLKLLDLSWVDSVNDNLIKDLLASPSDSRPGLLDTKTRLRHLVEVRLAGSDISDVSVRLLSNHLPQLSKLDLSNCHKVTDMSIAVLGAAKISKLQSLNLSSCSNISDTSLEALRRCQNLIHLDVRDCNQVSIGACQKFICSSNCKSKLIMKQSKLIQAKQMLF